MRRNFRSILSDLDGRMLLREFHCTLTSMSRIDGGIGTRFNSLNQNLDTANAGKSAQAPEVGQQVQQALFGKAKPPILDPAHFPQLAEQMKFLRKYKKKLAAMAGDEDEDYELVLADGTIAMIDESGTIYVGAKFLEACKDHPEILLGVLAHEIGHRPKRWDEYRERKQLTKGQLEALCRHEETRADIFAGKALAEMEMSWEPLAEFLIKLEDKPHPEYFPAKVRAEVLSDAHAGREYRTENRKKIFPEFDRMTSPKGHLGEG